MSQDHQDWSNAHRSLPKAMIHPSATALKIAGEICIALAHQVPRQMFHSEQVRIAAIIDAGLAEVREALRRIANESGKCGVCGRLCDTHTICDCEYSFWVPADPQYEAKAALAKLV